MGSNLGYVGIELFQHFWIGGLLLGAYPGFERPRRACQFNESQGEVDVGIEVAVGSLVTFLYCSAAPSRFFLM